MANGREMTAVVRAPKKCHEMGQKKKRKRMAVNLKRVGTSGRGEGRRVRSGRVWDRGPGAFEYGDVGSHGWGYARTVNGGEGRAVHLTCARWRRCPSCSPWRSVKGKREEEGREVAEAWDAELRRG